MELLNLAAVQRLKVLEVGGAHPVPSWSSNVATLNGSFSASAAPSAPMALLASPMRDTDSLGHASCPVAPATPALPTSSLSLSPFHIATSTAAAAAMDSAMPASCPPIGGHTPGGSYKPDPAFVTTTPSQPAATLMPTADMSTLRGAARAASRGAEPALTPTIVTGGRAPSPDEGHGTRALRAALRQALSAANSLQTENQDLRVRLHRAESLLAVTGRDEDAAATAPPPQPQPPGLSMRARSNTASGSGAGVGPGGRFAAQHHHPWYADGDEDFDADALAGAYSCLLPLPLSQWLGTRGRAITAAAALPYSGANRGGRGSWAGGAVPPPGTRVLPPTLMPGLGDGIVWGASGDDGRELPMGRGRSETAPGGWSTYSTSALGATFPIGEDEATLGASEAAGSVGGDAAVSPQASGEVDVSSVSQRTSSSSCLQRRYSWRRPSHTDGGDPPRRAGLSFTQVPCCP